MENNEEVWGHIPCSDTTNNKLKNSSKINFLGEFFYD